MSTSTLAHNAIVLAAGGSRRLGQSKQLLTRQGEPLVARAVRLAIATHPQRLLLIVGAHAEDVVHAAHDRRVEVVINPQWEEGLASSLRFAACALAREASPSLIVGCDQAALEAHHLAALCDGYATRGCAATRHGDARGLPAMVPADLLSSALSLQGDVGLRGVLKARDDEHLFLLDAPELDFDVDTPEDLRLARERGWVD